MQNIIEDKYITIYDPEIIKRISHKQNLCKYVRYSSNNKKITNIFQEQII